MAITFLKTAAAWVVAVFVSAVLGSLFSSQIVFAEFGDIGFDIPLQDRAVMTLKDFGILETLLPIYGLCLLIGFLIARFVIKLNSSNDLFWYTLAGASAVLSTLLLISYAMQLMPLAGAKTSLGLILQATAGAIGGLCFGKLKPQRSPAHT